MRIYISIPITGYDLATQQAKADDIANKLRELGHEPVSPLPPPEVPKGLTEKEEYAFYMGEAIRKLLTCDAIFLFERWTKSKGCRIEQNAAYVMRLEEFYSIESIPREL